MFYDGSISGLGYRRDLTEDMAGDVAVSQLFNGTRSAHKLRKAVALGRPSGENRIHYHPIEGAELRWRMVLHHVVPDDIVQKHALALQRAFKQVVL